jgi:hypothetical protein
MARSSADPHDIGRSGYATIKRLLKEIEDLRDAGKWDRAEFDRIVAEAKRLVGDCPQMESIYNQEPPPPGWKPAWQQS